MAVSFATANDENMSLVLDRLLLGYDKRLRPGFGGRYVDTKFNNYP